MFIKQIIIQGFKSYKDQTVIEPFSPKHNVIVGRNGSGKSNFFAAIRFVLSDAYTQMGKEERSALLHEGSGSAVMSAYVEIIFDNSDERFPTGKEELILRRTIGLKKDEYSLDRKNATKADVMNLLESAGFSRSNPYYIVPQGRVTTLTNMKDHERLNLLKEVAGTQVYEARRTESIRIMGETDAKRAKIDELLDYIKDRLAELEEEKEELKEYQTHDKERRCLEYTIYHREQEECNRILEKLEEQRATGVDETDENRERQLEGEKVLSRIDEEIKALKQRMELLKVDKKQYEDERRDTARERAKIELEVKHIIDGQSAAQNANARFEQDLAEVQGSIKQKEQQLSQVLPKYNTARDQENVIKTQLAEAEGTRSRLYAKQGRNAKFSNKNERDNWLRKEVEDVNVALATRKAVTMQTTEEIAVLKEDIQKGDAEIAELRQGLENRGATAQSLDAEVQKAKEARDKLQDQRKDLWREQAKLDSVMRNAQQEYDSAERFLSRMMDQNTSRGLAAVRRLKKNEQVDGLYGTLAELFDVSDKYKTAVEVTAGASLFHYVVDNDETASRVVDMLQKDKAGRVTFMPLNKLRPKGGNLPQANDAIEMVAKLNFDPKFTRAFQQVFGRTIICPNLQIAAQYARSHGVSAITPEGDRSDKKGALTGGYVDPGQSRLDAVQKLAKWRDECDQHYTRSEEIRRELEQKDQEVTRSVGELQKAEQKRSQFERGYGPMQQELRNKGFSVQAKHDALEAKERSKIHVEAALRELAQQQSSYETELASPFKKALPQAEEQQLEQLSSSIPDLRRQAAELGNARSELEAQKVTLEVELRENLRPRLDGLSSQKHEGGSSTGAGAGNAKLKSSQQDLKRCNKAAEAVDKKLTEAEQALEEANAKLTDANQRRDVQLEELAEVKKAIERYQKVAEKNISKRSLLAEKALEAQRNIRDLGVLPEDAFSGKYASIPSDKAIKRLHTTQTHLKKYSHVNKKAFEQYASFTRQRDDLTLRRAELDKSQAAIRDLIDVLDQRKDEAIERTFKQVSKEFAGIFEKLVPAGRGRLVIQRKSDKQQQQQPRQEGEDDEDGEGEGDGGEGEAGKEGVENYTGVTLLVSFNSRLHNDRQLLPQLSGGQKSLCALALILAIQQCDPAPFYLFDEIDANLDAQYRTAVAELLKEISNGGGANNGGAPAQFICTTFRPEMVLAAEKCYGVSFSNKTSSVDVVGREEALEFVEGQISGA